MRSQGKLVNPNTPISPARRQQDSSDPQHLTLAQRVIARELSERGTDQHQAVGLMLDSMGHMFRAVAHQS
ncbi:hypothetical protein WH7805_04826 [Synechococcus sp. WH 7805]|nr:hypothetical protein WH7805_04826 [Synechococcus sp. WH 7805]